MKLKSIINWIKNLFSKEADSYPEATPPAPPIPEIPTQEEVEEFPVNKNLKIALIRGHGSDDSGAVGNGTSEVEYNTWVMEYVLANTKRNVKLFYGKKSMDTVLKSVLWMPDISIQLHLNDADNVDANGVEVLVVKGDTGSYPLAEKFAKAYAERFGAKIRRDKGKKILPSGDRGDASLRASVGKKILVEPFFIRNKNDFKPKEEYAKFLLEFIDKI